MARSGAMLAGGPPEPGDPAAAGRERAAPELTLRAVAAGCGIGAVLAAGNVYTGLKSTFIDGGALTAALLSFTVFALLRRGGRERARFGPLENNIAQTAASSAAVMAFVHGLMGPMPALELGWGTRPAAWALWTWGAALAVVGIGAGALLRRKLVQEDNLPFPSGTATAELIQAVHAEPGVAARSTRLLLGAALAAAAVTWLRDGRPSLLPQAFHPPLTLGGGVAAAALTLGLAPSPLLAATGMFIGMRGAATLLGGGILAFGLGAPALLRAGWVREASYGALAGWLVWPALGLMLGSILVPPLLAGRELLRALARVLGDARASWRGRAGAGPADRARRLLLRARIAAGLAAAVVLVWTGWRAFGLDPRITSGALVLSVLLAGVCARAAGETDIAPVGSVGTVAQLVFAAGGPTASLLSGAIAAGTATQTAQSLWAFKAGHRLGSSGRAQIVAQLLGALAGSLVVVPVYFLVASTYGLGTEVMPAVSALSWKATAEAVAQGLSGLPPHGHAAAAVGFVVGAALSALGRTRAGRHLPSPIVLGIALITPVSLSAAAFLGALALALASRRSALLAAGGGSALAAGALAGESLTGVLIAALSAAGAL
jgi:putative OPT family oligopeptide transporter